MRQLLVLTIALALQTPAVSAQIAPGGPGMSPKEIVDQLWKMATQGELLTPDGWNRASRFYRHPGPPPGNKIVLIMSNYWGPGEEHIRGNNAEVIVGYVDAGKIDSELRYTPPQKTDALKTGMLFRLILAPSHWPVLGPDGKIEREATGAMEWEIESPQGLPWTTVNTAIRYVLETRDKTTGPAIKMNADRTLTALEKRH
jgi:hypothetical protein